MTEKVQCNKRLMISNMNYCKFIDKNICKKKCKGHNKVAIQ